MQNYSPNCKHRVKTKGVLAYLQDTLACILQDFGLMAVRSQVCWCVDVCGNVFEYTYIKIFPSKGVCVMCSVGKLAEEGRKGKDFKCVF
jgi:hypothetical protein